MHGTCLRNPSAKTKKIKINSDKMMYTYYTPFFVKIQVLLAKMAFFVDYDGELCQYFYVNHLCGTKAVFYHFEFFDNILRVFIDSYTKY